jgi:alkylation response protein AidB-like acyl-CoA dehydrogenase
MNFDLSEEQNLTRQAIRAFAEKQIAPIARGLDEREEFSVDLTREMADLGLLGKYWQWQRPPGGGGSPAVSPGRDIS